jgi:hypothetical protein
MSVPADGSIRELFPPRGEVERAALLAYAREAPLIYGEWRTLKRLYKDAEVSEEAAILGTLIGRLDAAPWPARPLYGLPVSSDASPPVVPHARRVVLQGRYAYVLAGDRLLVIDISAPAAPKVVGSHGVRASVLAVEGGHVYLGGEGLRIVDVSDPSRPRQVGVLETGLVRAMAVADRHVYLVAEAGSRSPGGLLIADLTDPAAPRPIGFLGIPSASDLALAGRHLYVTEAVERRSWIPFLKSGGLRVIDVADWRRPQQVASANIGPAEHVVVSGSRAVVAGVRDRRGRTALAVLDLADPSRPRRVATQQMWGAQDLALADRFLYVAGTHASAIFDLANPGGARPAWGTPFPRAQDLAISGTVLAVAAGPDGLLLFDLTNPARPAQFGASPSAETLGYMKRRGRRCLRRLARSEPERYVVAAFHALVVSGRGRSSLDVSSQWIAAEILFGGSGRLDQARHGRGPVYLREARPTLRRREELAPEAWDRHPELAGQLCALTDLPWETHEGALKMLRAARLGIPTLTPETVNRFVSAPSALLNVAGGREGARQIVAGVVFDAALSADVYLAAGGRQRRELASHWRERADGAAWDEAFAERLAGRAADRAQRGRLTARIVAAAGLLAGPFAAALAARGGFGTRPALVAALLASGREELLALATAAAATTAPAAAVPWLEACEGVSEARREGALEALRTGLWGKETDLATARQLVGAASPWVRAAGWRVLEVLAVEPALLAALWGELLTGEADTPALQTALDSEAALALLGRVRLDAAGLRAQIDRRLFQAREFSSEAFARLARALPAAETVRIVATVAQGHWDRLRDPLLEALVETGWRAEFWQAVWMALPEDATGLLARRVLDDAPVADSFLAVEAEDLFGGAPAGAGAMLLRWIGAHEVRFDRDTPLLLAAATCPLPEVRAWGLARVRSVGMDLPFALRLLESGLPEPMEAGREFFAAVAPGEEREAELALALCDSPAAAVRAYGREYVRERKASLPMADVIRGLGEHADPVMREFVAQLLIEEPGVGVDTASFDRETLRARDRARRAKELVKARLTPRHGAREGEAPPPQPTGATPVSTEKVALLLELARGRTPRDAEWALEQLARLALDGQEIEGLTLEGTAGV